MGKEILPNPSSRAPTNLHGLCLHAFAWIVIALVPCGKALSLAPRQSGDSFNCDRDYILLYTLGKTGSSSFQTGVRHACPGRFRGHGFPYLAATENQYPHGIKVHKEHDVAADFLDKIPANSTVWVVTLVRNPFERMISTFTYHNWCDLVKYSGGTDPIWEQTIAHWDHFVQGSTKEFFEAWAKTMGVDALTLPFDHTKKIGKFTTTDDTKRLTLKFLVLRSDDIADWDKIMEPIIPGFYMEHKKSGSSSVYAEFHSPFVQGVTFTEEQVQSMLSGRGELAFYSDEEIAEMEKNVPRVPDAASRKLHPEIRKKFAHAVRVLRESPEVIQRCALPSSEP